MNEFGTPRTIKRRNLLDCKRLWQTALRAWPQPWLLTVGCFGALMAASGDMAKAAPKEDPASAQEAGAPANESAPKRVPKKKPVTDASRGGRIYETEPTPIAVSGATIDDKNQPVRGAKIYLVAANGFGAFGPAAILAETTTDGTGRYAFTEAMLPVRMFPPAPEIVEGKFQVFGVSEKHGFTWHAVRAYRPRPRPATDTEPEMDRAYYARQPIKCNLFFEPTVALVGQVRDDLGNPVAGAKVQVGVIDDARRKNSTMWRFELLAGKDDSANPDRRFTCINSLPRGRLSTLTDADGRYEIARLPKEASFVAAVFGPPEFGTVTATVASSDRDIPGTISAGRNGWNSVLAAPRATTVRTIDLDTKKPLANIVLHAYGGQMRFGGNDARTDAEGSATLRLPPGHYRLVAEPAAESQYVRTEQEFDVGKEPEQSVTLGVQRGAVIILVVSVDDSVPVEGVGFCYETDDSRERHELQSQTVFVDHPRTDRDGVLRAVVAPGRRRLLAGTLPKGYESPESEGELADLVAGSTTTLHFALRTKADETKTIAADNNISDVESRLQAAWRRQNEFAFKGVVTYRMTVTATNDYVITRDEIRDVVARFNPSADDDIAAWINRHFPELAVSFAGPFQMTIDGRRHRRALAESRDHQAPAPAEVETFNGAEIVRYDPVNAQASVDDARVSYVHIDGPADLRRWPLYSRLSQGTTDGISHADGQITMHSKTDDFSRELVADEATGFVYQWSAYETARGSGNDTWQFASIELPDGMIWPRLRIELRYDHDELSLIEIRDIASIEPKPNLPADAFVVSLPAGTLVLASDFGAAVAGRREDQPHSPKQGMATGPVTDAVQFAYALSPRSRVLWPVVKPGQISPQLDAAAWITAEGEPGPPDLANKRVLIDFWSQGCGPCVGELPKLVKLAKQYEQSDLVIIGWHESRADVESLTEFARAHGLPYALAIDRAADEPGWFGALFKSFGVRGIPQAALIDRDGRIVFVGYLDQVIAKLDGG